MKKLLLLLLVVTALLISPYMRASAQAASELPTLSTTLKITPVIIPLQLTPDQSISIPITIDNISASPQALRASFSDFDTTSEDGGYSFTDTKSNPLLSWSSVSPQEILIPAHSKQTVTLTIKTPRQVPIGGYFGMLFFEPVLSPQAVKESTQIVPRIGVLLLGSVGVQDRPQTSILSLDLPLITDRVILPLTLRVKNEGLQYKTIKPIIRLKTLTGDQQKITFDDKVVFPGKVRRWTESITLPKMWDVTHLSMSVSSGNGQIITTERTIFVFPYKGIALLLFIALLAGFLFVKRRNLSNAVRILLGKDK